MVQERHDDGGTGCEFVIRPNASLSGRHATAFFSGLCGFTLAIALACWWMGAWVVMVFACAELAFVGGALYCCLRRSRRRELITIRDGGVEVSCGGRALERQWRAQSYWTWVRLEPSGHEWYGSRLKLVSHGRAVEVGAFLHEEERCALARRLGTALRR